MTINEALPILFDAAKAADFRPSGPDDMPSLECYAERHAQTCEAVEAKQIREAIEVMKEWRQGVQAPTKRCSNPKHKYW